MCSIYRTVQFSLFLIILSCYSLSAAESIKHTVQPGESLFGLARQYDCSVEELKEMNSLNRDVLYSGEKLIIPQKYPDQHRVEPGETLSGISLRYGIPQKKLISLNRLNRTQLKASQILELIRPPFEGEIWTVRKGETLSWISLKFDISQDRLMQINALSDKSLKEGQQLSLTASRPQLITIKNGDSLWKVSTLYDVPLDKLKRWNGLDSDSLYEGMVLQLYPVVLDLGDAEGKTLPGIENRDAQPEETAEVTEPETRLAQVELSPALFYSRPTLKRTQPDPDYSETDLNNPYENYSRASQLLNDFDSAVRTLPPLSSTLKGYTVILDPGHGGLDPGAIVKSSDGYGNIVYVVEDEYCYDISLRVYRDLVRHGADVKLTVISPNQTIRTSEDASLTFVNEKNEVYNSSSINRLNRSSVWPVGNIWGLEQRKAVSAEFLKNTDREKSVYISIHADNNIGDGEGTRILFHPDETGMASEDLARHLSEYMGMDSRIRSQEIRVLSRNPAGAAVLVEVRNLAYKNNAWAIRNEELRQDDADRIVRGIVSFFK